MGTGSALGCEVHPNVENDKKEQGFGRPQLNGLARGLQLPDEVIGDFANRGGVGKCLPEGELTCHDEL